MGYGYEKESAGKFVFVNLYSARTRGRQDKNKIPFCPTAVLEPSFVRYPFAVAFQFIALQSLQIRYLVSLLATPSFFDICVCALYVSSCFPFYRLFCCLKSKKIISVICCYTLAPIYFCISTFYCSSYLRQKCHEQTHPTLTIPRV